MFIHAVKYHHNRALTIITSVYGLFLLSGFLNRKCQSSICHSAKDPLAMRNVPRSLPGAFSPIFLVTWAFGLGVIEYPLGRRRWIISTFLSIANCLFYFGFLKMANLSNLETFHKSKTAARGRRINSYVCAAFVASSICIAKINAKVFNGVFPKLTSINDRLNILGNSNGYEYIFKFQIIQLGIAFSFMSVLMGLDFKYVGSEFGDELSRIGFLMSVHYMLMFAFIIDCSFGATMRYLGNRFQCLNQLLVESNSVEKDGPSVSRKTKNDTHYPSIISEIHRYDSIGIRAADQRWLLYVIRETRFVNKKLRVRLSQVRNIRFCTNYISRKIHRGLCKVAIELNGACGTQVLLSLALSLDLLISLLHIAYNLAVASFRHGLIQHHGIHVINNLMWNSFFALKILLIVDACETTSSEANRTGELISKLRNISAMDEELRDEINIFSLQLIQNPLKFSANGFFTLNYSLIRGIIGTVTTYLIIIIQIQSIYEPERMIPMQNSTTSTLEFKKT